MPPQRFFTGILSLICFLAACAPLTPAPTPLPLVFTPSPVVPTLAPIASAIPATITPQPTVTATPAGVTGLPDTNQFQWVAVAKGFSRPTAITQAGDDRLFIVEQVGRIRILQSGQLQPVPFLDLSSQIKSSGSEQGLLGLAFHPRYQENGFFYVNYIDLDGNTVIARFQVSADPDVADPGSEKRLLSVRQPFANHNGGQLAFGPDGYLYIGLGDGGSAGDPYGNGQSTNTLLGKILRLDVDQGDPYTIPADNPFAQSGGEPEIWATGLRNPWRFSFDALTGDLYIADVGQNLWEEVDFLPAGAPGGANFGWNAMEGASPYQGSNSPTFTAPISTYSHAQGCSITGGYVYRGQSMAAWQGVYLYGDYCSGKIWGLLKTASGWQVGLLFETGFRLSTFGLDRAGEIYLADYASGTLYRLDKR